jgi:hypothetical protein
MVIYKPRDGEYHIVEKSFPKGFSSKSSGKQSLAPDNEIPDFVRALVPKIDIRPLTEQEVSANRIQEKVKTVKATAKTAAKKV